MCHRSQAHSSGRLLCQEPQQEAAKLAATVHTGWPRWVQVQGGSRQNRLVQASQYKHLQDQKIGCPDHWRHHNSSRPAVTQMLYISKVILHTWPTFMPTRVQIQYMHSPVSKHSWVPQVWLKLHTGASGLLEQAALPAGLFPGPFNHDPALSPATCSAW